MSDKVRFTANTDAGWKCDSNVVLNDGKLHVIVGTYDANGGSENVKLYVDGELQTDTETTTGSIVSIDKFNIANINDRTTSTYNFNGTIYTAAIYNKAKSWAWVKQETNRAKLYF